MSTLTCVTISTLVIISLINLAILMGIMMQMKKKCEDIDVTYEIPNNVKFNRLSSLVKARQSKNIKPKFLAALVVIKYNTLVLMCGTTIISKFWILTTAHCCLSVKKYPKEDVKISSNSPKWKMGIARDIEHIIMHANYTPSTVTHNICLIKVKQSFNEEFEISIPLAGSRYAYIANSTSLTTGWNPEINDEDFTTDDIYSSQVRLVNYDVCQKIFKNTKVDKTMVCGQIVQSNEACSFDSGGPLFQNDAVIGVASFETDCASGRYPRVYTRLSYFQEWIMQIEGSRGVRVNARFKN